MKIRMTIVAVMISSLAVISGCANQTGLIKKMATNTRTDVFQESSGDTPIPPGYADLRIVSSLKTHMPGVYSGKDVHGTTDYKLLLNIDGQSTEVVAHPREEQRDLHATNDPEEGNGMRYLFQKELRLNAGLHKIFISFPDDDIAVVREIEVTEGTRNTLVLDPVYRLAKGKRRIGFYTKASFKEGIKGFRIKLNGNEL